MAPAAGLASAAGSVSAASVAARAGLVSAAGLVARLGSGTVPPSPGRTGPRCRARPGVDREIHRRRRAERGRRVAAISGGLLLASAGARGRVTLVAGGIIMAGIAFDGEVRCSVGCGEGLGRRHVPDLGQSGELLEPNRSSSPWRCRTSTWPDGCVNCPSGAAASIALRSRAYRSMLSSRPNPSSTSAHGMIAAAAAAGLCGSVASVACSGVGARGGGEQDQHGQPGIAAGRQARPAQRQDRRARDHEHRVEDHRIEPGESRRDARG